MKTIRPKCLLIIVLMMGLLLTTPLEGSAAWWDKYGEPEYGGTLTFAIDSFPSSFDPYTWMNLGSICFEQLLCPDWTIEDRSLLLTAWIPDEYITGHLVESWEFSDPKNLVIRIRKGVRWQDKPPVNGREFTAFDVQYHYDRLLGSGSGFTEPNPTFIGMTNSIEQVIAEDKYTAVIKFKKPTPPVNFWTFSDYHAQDMEAREWVDQGDTQNWEKNVGTGPWMLEEVNFGSSITAVRNPNYWGYDERHPKNRLPYLDSFKQLLIPDKSTALAAFRTGKIDCMWNVGWQTADSLSRGKSKILMTKGNSTPLIILARNDRKPFTDLRVRIALDMAVDRKTIADGYYNGNANPTPWGVLFQAYEGYCYSYKDWPQKLKDEYSYNPQKAKGLLAQAGYPNGFKTNCIVPAFLDVELLEVVKSYFMDIGVDMEIRVMDPATATAMVMPPDKKNDQMDYWMAWPRPWTALNVYKSSGQNRSNHNDAKFDALVENFFNATNQKEAKKWLVEADKYSIEQHLVGTRMPVQTVFHVWQPYLMGTSGEGVGGAGIESQFYWARFWIDRDLKKTMGR